MMHLKAHSLNSQIAIAGRRKRLLIWTL